MDLFTLGLLQKNLSGNKGDIKSKNGESSYTITDAVDFPVLGLNLYGKSVQDGTPTPENPVDIVSVGDNGFDIISKNDTHFNLLSVRDNGGNSGNHGKLGMFCFTKRAGIGFVHCLRNDSENDDRQILRGVGKCTSKVKIAVGFAFVQEKLY